MPRNLFSGERWYCTKFEYVCGRKSYAILKKFIAATTVSKRIRKILKSIPRAFILVIKVRFPTSLKGNVLKQIVSTDFAFLQFNFYLGFYFVSAFNEESCNFPLLLDFCRILRSITYIKWHIRMLQYRTSAKHTSVKWIMLCASSQMVMDRKTPDQL